MVIYEKKKQKKKLNKFISVVNESLVVIEGYMWIPENNFVVSFFKLTL